MLALIKKICVDITTEADGDSFDVARLLWIAGTIVFFAMSIWAIVKNHQPLDWQNFGIGFASVLAGGGLGVGVRAKMEKPIP